MGTRTQDTPAPPGVRAVARGLCARARGAGQRGAMAAQGGQARMAHGIGGNAPSASHGWGSLCLCLVLILPSATT
jgi:hypothetical protein